MPHTHQWQQIARVEADKNTSYEVERCVKCDERQVIEVHKSKVPLDTSLQGCEPYLKTAYHDISYVMINYGAKDYKGIVSDPHALERAMEAFVAAYNLTPGDATG